jgi:hypothetical protein
VGTTLKVSNTNIGGGNLLQLDRATLSRVNGITFSTAGVEDWSLGVLRNGGSPTQVFSLSYQSGTNTNSIGFAVTAGGNVGIGTTSPGYKLDVQGTGTSTPLRVVSSGNTSILLSRAGTTDNGDATLTVTNSGALNIAAENVIRVIPFTSEIARFTNTGLGIGTTSPNAKLDVAGDALINGLTIGRGPGNVATNTALGAGALGGNSSGTNNIAIGKSANWFSDLSGTTVIGNEMASSTSGGLLPSNCLAISQFNPEFTGAQYPHFYAPQKISVNNGTTADVIAFSVDAYSGAFIEYVIRTTDGGEFAAGTVTVAWKSSGSGNLKDNRDVVWSSFMDDFEFILTGNTVQLRNQSTDDAWIRITVRAIMSDNLL